MERGSLIMFFTRIEREVLANVAASTNSHLLFFHDPAVMLGKEKKEEWKDLDMLFWTLPYKWIVTSIICTEVEFIINV